MSKISRQAKQFLELTKQFQYTDLIGFGNMFEINDDQEFIDYLTDIIAEFEKLPKERRVALVKLAKSICLANKEAREKLKEKGELEWGEKVGEKEMPEVR